MTRTPEWKTVKGAVPSPVGNLRSDAPRMGEFPTEDEG